MTWRSGALTCSPCCRVESCEETLSGALTSGECTDMLSDLLDDSSSLGMDPPDEIHFCSSL